MHSVFWGIDPEIWHTCPMGPSRAFDECVFLFFVFFPPEMLEKYPPKKKEKQNIWQTRKQKQKHPSTVLQGLIEHVCHFV